LNHLKARLRSFVLVDGCVGNGGGGIEGARHSCSGIGLSYIRMAGSTDFGINACGSHRTVAPRTSQDEDTRDY
jgi:hypothetical protein